MEKAHVHDNGSSSPTLDEKDVGYASRHHHETELALAALGDPDAGVSDEERRHIDRHLVNKLDWMLIPWLSFLYLISFLDRTNIGNAKVDGLVKDLHMTGGQYNACLSLFFVSYAGFEPLTNILLKRMRPSIFLPLIMVLWGITMTTMGLSRNFSDLAAIRFILGITEAGLFPGVVYYLSCWYKRSEFGIRSAIFFSAAALAGSFGGLLAAGIAQMRGVGGYPGWSWIFILEGLVTVVVGLISPWFVHDFPDDAKFLSEADRQRIYRRLKLDGQSSAEHENFQMSYVWVTLKDWKTYAFALIYAGADCALYAFSLFLPSIIAALGYSSTKANLLTVPPYAAAAISTITVGWIADRTGKRGLCNMACALLGITGFSMLIGSSSASVKYAAVFLAAMGIYPTIPNTVSWVSNNTEGVYKRGITLGIVIGFGNMNGIVSSNIYIAKEAPKYRTGHGVVLAYLSILLLGGSIVVHLLLGAENRARQAGKRDGRVVGKSASEIELLGDQRPDFNYVT